MFCIKKNYSANILKSKLEDCKIGGKQNQLENNYKMQVQIMMTLSRNGNRDKKSK